MSADELRGLLDAVPFKPFTVYMANDRAFEIPHPDFALLTPKGRTLVVASNEDKGVNILDVPLIARMEMRDGSERTS